MLEIPDSIEVQGGPITLVFSRDGRAFFSERITGNVWEIIGKEDYRLIKHLPVINATGHHEAGVLGIALDPKFDKNGYIYAYYTSGDDIKHASNNVVRFAADNSSEKMLISGIPGGYIHNGGIIAFGPDNKLYVGVGVANTLKEKSQDKSYLGGKILRINSDGSIPSDNPFSNSPVYSLGHRNIFGLAFHPKTGMLYACDVGPDSDDEIDIIQSGGNYGWPEVMGYANDSRFISPIVTYTPTITPTQSVFYDNDLYFGSYNEGNIHKISFSEDGSRVVSDVIVYQGKPFGITGVFVSPKHDFFVTTTNKIMKIKLKKGENKVKNKSVIWVGVMVLVIALGIGGYFIYNNYYKTKSVNNNQTTVMPGVVTIQDFSFKPGAITINKGDTVTWQNNDSFVHRIVADDNSFDLGSMAGGGSTSHRFNEMGTFGYHCSIHTYMKGEVVVK